MPALHEQIAPLITDMVEGLTEGCVVPFLGAGVNCCGRPADFSWRAGTGFLPAGAELSQHLARISGYPLADKTELSNLLRVSQYMVTKKGYGPLRDALRKVLVGNFRPTPVHRLFARLPRILKEKNYGVGVQGFQILIVTTNYDDLLEQAFVDEGVEFDLLVYRSMDRGRGSFWHKPPGGQPTRIEKPNEYSSLSLDVRPVIVKIHGAINRQNFAEDSYVITEDDYIDYLAGADLSNFLPVVIKNELVNSHFLFLGYSLQDWNLRVFLKKIWDDQQKFDYKSWAVQRAPNEVDQELWRSRKVEIIDLSLEEYVPMIEQHLQALPPASNGDV